MVKQQTTKSFSVISRNSRLLMKLKGGKKEIFRNMLSNKLGMESLYNILEWVKKTE